MSYMSTSLPSRLIHYHSLHRLRRMGSPPPPPQKKTKKKFGKMFWHFENETFLNDLDLFKNKTSYQRNTFPNDSFRFQCSLLKRKCCCLKLVLKDLANFRLCSMSAVVIMLLWLLVRYVVDFSCFVCIFKDYIIIDLVVYDIILISSIGLRNTRNTSM